MNSIAKYCPKRFIIFLTLGHLCCLLIIKPVSSIKSLVTISRHIITKSRGVWCQICIIQVVVLSINKNFPGLKGYAFIYFNLLFEPFILPSIKLENKSIYIANDMKYLESIPVLTSVQGYSEVLIGLGNYHG